MKLAAVIVREKRFETRWNDQLRSDYSVCVGTVPTEYQQYQCDHCGHVHNLVGTAGEPFYCAKCPQLVSVSDR